MITSKTKVCMVIGDPVDHSNSPQIHNAGYKALGIDFVYVGCRVKQENIKGFIDGVKAMGIKGVSLTSPHKEIVYKYIDHIDKTAEEIGAVNTIVNRDGVLYGYNTDWIGAIQPIKAHKKLKGIKAAVLGAGGAGRALVYGLKKEDCKITIFNRTIVKAQALAEQFNTDFSGLDNKVDWSAFDLICNVTTVGLNNPSQSPIDTKSIHSGQIVFDAVYSPIKTKLLSDAEAAGATIIFGTEMLLALGSTQFSLFTDQDAPKDSMMQAINRIVNAR